MNTGVMHCIVISPSQQFPVRANRESGIIMLSRACHSFSTSVMQVSLIPGLEQNGAWYVITCVM